MSAVRYLLDVNVLVALFDGEHTHHGLVARWFAPPDLQWGLCAFSEAGFLRVFTNPAVGNRTMVQAANVLRSFASDPGYQYWPIAFPWDEYVAAFHERVWGHQQVTDAYLLGLAIKENGILVTLDKAIRTLAGPRFAKHVMVLE